VALQSLSLFALAPFGQQLSPFIGEVTGELVHRTLHCIALPVSRSDVQGSPSSHSVLQRMFMSALVGSHVSGASTRPSPQLIEQSLSLPKSQPIGQHRSPDAQIAICFVLHTASHFDASPWMTLSTQGSRCAGQSSAVGQLPSHFSAPSTMSLPHRGGALIPG
jgi:hypothetical protein